MIVENAGYQDAEELTCMRLAYLKEDYGTLQKKDEETIRELLPGYFRKHLNQDLFGYVVRDNEEIVSCALLLVTQKPMSPAFINGKTGTVLNVYTKPEHRHKGYAKAVMEYLMSEASKMNLSVVELKATDAGYSLYKAIGFEDDRSGYHLMKWKNN